MEYKCSSCGANVLDTKKCCEYCGTTNPNYKKEDIELPNANFDTISNSSLNEVLKNITNMVGPFGSVLSNRRRKR